MTGAPINGVVGKTVVRIHPIASATGTCIGDRHNRIMRFSNSNKRTYALNY